MIEFKKEPDNVEELNKLLHPVVREWFYSKFKSFSLPQLYGTLEIHSRNNVLISAPTGATKTLTAFLAILNELVDSAKKNILKDKVYCLYVSPLKALNYDIEQNLLGPLSEIEKINKGNLGIRVSVRTGDTTSYEKSKMLQTPPHILITTPESLAIMLSSTKFSKHLNSVDWCIIDEIHAMADNKRGVHLNLSVERLNYRSPQLCRIGLSATVAPIEEIAKYLVGDRDCKIIDVNFIKETDIKVVTPLKNLIDIEPGEFHNEFYRKIHKYIAAHKTTLIFTNTRSATERVVYKLKELYPDFYNEENIGAHHGSLDKKHRHALEEGLRKGRLRAVVCSTSLELGIDIGYIDLVICLGSPKSVARTLQRIGRSGHKLTSVTKGRIIVTDNDDLIECACLVKNALDRKIDRISIPHNALDVLTQHIFGMALEQVWDEKELYNLIRKSYCYHTLRWDDYTEVLKYLAGEFASLEDRHVYAKIWRKDGKIGRRGRMSRVIYMTNIGTIPDQSGVLVKEGNKVIGTIDESFLEKLRKGDVFVLGGKTYIFKYSRGMSASVEYTTVRPPTVPSWFSDVLPISFDLAMDIGKFKRLVLDRFNSNEGETKIINFIREYLNVDKTIGFAIYNYLAEQYDYTQLIPNDKLIVIEHYKDDDEFKIIFHAMYGRRVNDVLSRAVAYAIARIMHKDVQIGINDNGFYISSRKNIDVMRALKFINSEELYEVASNAIMNTEVFKRRFRHCAGRSMMILRSYKGHTKRVGKQQLSSMILLNAVKRISPDFFIIRETKREVLEDMMDIKNARLILQRIENKEIQIKEITTSIPSPFALNIALLGHIDILKIDDRIEFLKRMHNLIKAKIALDKSKSKKKIHHIFDYEDYWNEKSNENKEKQDFLIRQLNEVDNSQHIPRNAYKQLVRIIRGERKNFPKLFLDDLDKHLLNTIPKNWPKELAEFLKKARREIKP